MLRFSRAYVVEADRGRLIPYIPQFSTNKGFTARCGAKHVIDVEIRERSARVAALQRNLDRMFALIDARAADYEHEGTAPSTEMLVKD